MQAVRSGARAAEPSKLVHTDLSMVSVYAAWGAGEPDAGASVKVGVFSESFTVGVPLAKTFARYTTTFACCAAASVAYAPMRYTYGGWADAAAATPRTAPESTGATLEPPGPSRRFPAVTCVDARTATDALPGKAPVNAAAIEVDDARAPAT